MGKASGLSYGWVVVAVGALMTCVAFGSMLSLAVFLQPISEAMGWSRSGVSAAATINFLAMGLAAFFWGTLSDRFGTRIVVLSGSLLLGAGLIGAGPGALGALHLVEATPADRTAYWQLRGALAPEIERLIERLLAASDRSSASVPRRFQRAGRLDRNRLPAAVAGREAVFTRFVHEPQPATAFCLLLDCSASMVPYAEQLREVAILLESATAALGAQVTAFTFGATWERMQPPAVGAPLVALGRELRPRGGTPFGPALQAAAAWLNHQPYKEKRLWVFSDGRWSARDRVDVAWRADLLRDVVVWVLTDDPPVPPSPAMRIVAAPLLADLVELAPAHYWGGAARRDGGRP
jgi:hypothetical protein